MPTGSHILAASDPMLPIVAGVVVVFLLVFIFLILPVLGLWLQAFVAKAKIGLLEIVAMRLQKVDPRIIILCLIQAVRAGYDVTVSDLKSHHLAGGNVVKVVRGLLEAKRAKVDLSWKDAAAIDLGGYDVIEAVRTAADPAASGADVGTQAAES